MDVIKSVRVRKRVPTTEESTGTSDIKVTLYEKGRKKRIVKGFSLDSNSEEVVEIWKELKYDGERYENQTDNQIIEDFIRIKTLAERPQGDKIKMGFPPKDETFYQILQDPFDKKIPLDRSFGFDPYYLNNGAELYIKWFKPNITEIEWDFYNATPTGSMSVTGSVVIKIETNELNRQPLFFTYSAANNPIQNGVTPSYLDIEMYWDSVTSGGITQIAGLSANGVQYMLPGENFVNPEDLTIQGGKQYSKSIYDGGKIYTTENLKNVPPDIVRRIEVYPPKDSEGKFLEKPWAIEKSTNDSMTDVKLSYISDISTRIDLDYKYFKDELALNRLQYVGLSTAGTQSYLRDFDLIGDILQYWKKKVPNYEKLEVCSPDNLSCSITKYISPIDPVVDDIVELANVTPGLSPSIPGQTPSLPTKQKLNFIFPENFEIIERVAVPEFKIFVGDPPVLEIDGEFIAEDFDVDVSELDDEYKEGYYEGPEEDLDATSGVSFNWSEILRDENPPIVEASPEQQKADGVEFGGDKVSAPSGSVSKTSVSVPSELGGVQNSKVLKKQDTGSSLRDIIDITTPKGDKLKGEDIIRDMNQFIQDVLGPFAKWLKSKYPDVYKNWYITSATRGYVPKGGSLTSQHYRGQAIDSCYLGSRKANPEGNIKLINAILEWYKENPVGYGQILFETRDPSSCWIHWSYTRGVKKLMFARFHNDGTKSASANKKGSYVLPPLTKSSLGF
jgi:hypothetical protein